jgi:hypothetical protein
MDVSLFLAVAVAILIASSGYFLFNGVPSIGKERQRRPSRRS